MERHELEAPEAGRLDAVIAAALPELSRSRAAALVKEGAVEVDGAAVTKPASKVAAGARLVVTVPDPTPDAATPQDLLLDIVFEDPDVVVVNKAAGMVVHPAAGHPDGTLVNALLFHVQDLSSIGGVQRPGIVHRLDRGTTGLIIVAKNDHAHRHLAEQFAAHTAGRTYLALCMGEPETEAGTVRSLLARHPTDRMRWSSQDRGKEAITHWEVVARAGTITLIRCRLETGRTHQVRVHMTEQGWPLVGDPTYKRRGRRPPASIRELVPEERPMLHAHRLRFVHPRTEQPIELEAPIPADFQALLDALGIELA